MIRFFIVFVALCGAALAVIPCDRGFAQDSEFVATEELARFPWYESGEFKDLSEDDAGRASSAKSANRREVPKRVQRQKQTQNTTPPIPNQSWDFSWAQSLIWVALIGGVLALAAILLVVFLKMEKLSVNRSGEKVDEDVEDMSERIKELPFRLDEVPAAEGDLRTQAVNAAKSRDFRRATMLLYSHVLLTLDQNGLVQLKKGKTNRQYLRELNRHPLLIGYFEKIMISFEDSFFGDHDVKQSTFENCMTGLERFHIGIQEASQAAVL